MKEIVKYHNDFNKLRLPSFNELEQNLLFGMLMKIRDKQKCEFTADELKEFISSKNPTTKELYNYAIEVKNKFFRANFTEVKKLESGEFEEATYHLFKRCSIFYNENEKQERLLTKINLEIYPIFAYLVNELTANFTRFELAEFISINGKYTKTLYRLLKQYRHTGILKIEWNEFLRVMDISENYSQTNIDKWILKPAIKELSQPKNLFDTKRTPFNELSYKKIKDPKGRGRGGKVIGIEFYFTPEPQRNEIKEGIKKLKKLNNNLEKNSKPQEPKYHILTGEKITDLDGYKNRHFYIKNKEYGGLDTCKINDLKYIEHKGKKQIWALMLNQENSSAFEMFFDSIAHMKNALKLD